MVLRSDSASTASAGLPVSGRPTGTTSLRVFALLSAVALAGATVMSPEQAANGPVVCPFRLLTGLPCPGCGLTRAWVFALHGDLGAAMSANPFVLVTLPAAVVLVIAAGAAFVRRRPLPDARPLLGWVAVRALFAVWLAFAVVRAGAVLAAAATA